MEFIDGAQVNDVKKIQRLGIQPNEVAKLVSSSIIIHFWVFRKNYFGSFKLRGYQYWGHFK